MPPTLNDRLREYWDRLRVTLTAWWAVAVARARQGASWTRERAGESTRGMGSEVRERAPGAADAARRALRATGRALLRAAAWTLHHIPRPAGSPPAAAGVLEEGATIVARGEDDAASITGRIDTAPDVNVVLVVPRQARRLRQAGAWPHLAAHARRHGITLRVVSPRGDVRRHARNNGLRAVRRPGQLRSGQGLRLRVGDSIVRVPAPPVGPFLRVGVVGVVIAGGFVAACYQVPSATIMVAPNSETYTASRELQLSPVAQDTDLDAGIVRASTIREEVSTIVSTSTTGEAEVGDEPASVTLVFTNEGDEAVTIPAGTAVDDAEGIGFLTDEDIAVDPGESVAVTATAEQPGPIAHVSAEVLTRAEDLSPDIVVTNPEPAAGGTTRVAQAVSEADVERVQEIASQVIREVSRRALVDQFSDDLVVFEETINTAIFSETPLQQLEEPSEVLMVEYVIIVSAIVLRLDHGAEVGEQMIRNELPPHLALLSGTTSVEVVGDPRLEAGQVYTTLEATGMVADISALNGVADELAGTTTAEAIALLEERLSPLAPPQITITPELVPWRWLPWREERIQIFVVGPDFFEEDEEEAEVDDEEPPPEEEPPLDPLEEDLEGDLDGPANGNTNGEA